MYSVVPSTKAGEVGSHAVYPRASNVARSPPEGKLEASLSPLASILPEKFKIGSPCFTPSIKLSCLPLPVPVMGLNQWM